MSVVKKDLLLLRSINKRYLSELSNLKIKAYSSICFRPRDLMRKIGFYEVRNALGYHPALVIVPYLTLGVDQLLAVF